MIVFDPITFGLAVIKIAACISVTAISIGITSVVVYYSYVGAKNMIVKRKRIIAKIKKSAAYDFFNNPEKLPFEKNMQQKEKRVVFGQRV